MTDISKHPLLKACYEACLAIEKLGCSPEQTDAVSRVSDMMRPIEALVSELDAALDQVGMLGWVSVHDHCPAMDTGERVLIYTEGYDFQGEQFFDVKADDFYGDDDDLKEIIKCASHWRPLDYPGTSATAQQRVEAIRREATTELRQALRDYGRHIASIPELGIEGCDYDPEEGTACTCGLAAILGEKEG